MQDAVNLTSYNKKYHQDKVETILSSICRVSAMCPTCRKWGVSRDYDDATTRADEPEIIFNLVLNDNWNYMLPP